MKPLFSAPLGFRVWTSETTTTATTTAAAAREHTHLYGRAVATANRNQCGQVSRVRVHSSSDDDAHAADETPAPAVTVHPDVLRHACVAPFAARGEHRKYQRAKEARAKFTVWNIIREILAGVVVPVLPAYIEPNQNAVPNNRHAIHARV